MVLQIHGTNNKSQQDLFDSNPSNGTSIFLLRKKRTRIDW